MPATLDAKMETASRALADMDYARCEALCAEALAQARDAGDWVMYRRVLLPLQEARRQKRQAATDGLILLGTAGHAGTVEDLIEDDRAGCIVLTHPHAADDAATLDGLVRSAGRSIEVLFADNTTDAPAWRIRTFHNRDASTELAAPDRAWVGRWIDPLSIKPPTPAHWFMRASEALGDAALASVDAVPGAVEHLLQLEHALAAAGDHEILHQRLADAARALHEAGR